MYLSLKLFFYFQTQNPYLLFDSRLFCLLEAHIASSSASLDSARIERYEIWCFLLDKTDGP